MIQSAGMSTPSPEDLFERSFRFACDVYDYNKDRRKYLLQESNELVSIYVVIVRKLKAK